MSANGRFELSNEAPDGPKGIRWPIPPGLTCLANEGSGGSGSAHEPVLGFDVSGSEARAIFDYRASKLNFIDQFTFRNVRLTHGPSGLTIHAHKLKDVTALDEWDLPPYEGARTGTANTGSASASASGSKDESNTGGHGSSGGGSGLDASFAARTARDWAHWDSLVMEAAGSESAHASAAGPGNGAAQGATSSNSTGAWWEPSPPNLPPGFVNRAGSPTSVEGLVRGNAENGIILQTSDAPLSECGHLANDPHAPIYYFVRPVRAWGAPYHPTSDGLAQFWRLLNEMGNAPQKLDQADAGRGGYANRRPNILIVGPLDVSNQPTIDIWDGVAPVFMLYARALFDEVISYKDPRLGAGPLPADEAVAMEHDPVEASRARVAGSRAEGGLCAADIRVGLSLVYQEITWMHYGEAMGYGGLRPAIDVVLARLGIRHETNWERKVEADRARRTKQRESPNDWYPRYGPVPQVDLTGERPFLNSKHAPAPAPGSGQAGAEPRFVPPTKLLPFVWDNPTANSRRYTPPVWPPRVLLQIRRNSPHRAFRPEDEEYVKTAFGRVGVPVEVLAFTDAVPLKDQIAAFARGDIIIGFHGAGLTLGIFARPGALMVQVTPSGLQPEQAALFQRMAFLSQLGYFEWQERDLQHFLKWQYGSGLEKPVVGFRNEGYDPRDIRVFVISTLMAWMQSASALYA